MENCVKKQAEKCCWDQVVNVKCNVDTHTIYIIIMCVTPVLLLLLKITVLYNNSIIISIIVVVVFFSVKNKIEKK